MISCYSYQTGQENSGGGNVINLNHSSWNGSIIIQPTYLNWNSNHTYSWAIWICLWHGDTMEAESWRPRKSKSWHVPYTSGSHPHTSAQLQTWQTAERRARCCNKSVHQGDRRETELDCVHEEMTHFHCSVVGEQLTLLETRWYCISGHSKQHSSFVFEFVWIPC